MRIRDVLFRLRPELSRLELNLSPEYLIDTLVTDPNQEMTAPLTVIEHLGHRPETDLVFFDSIGELERHLIGPAGITNAFVTAAICLSGTDHRPYEVTYRSATGERIRFSKRAQLDRAEPLGEIPDPRVTWL